MSLYPINLIRAATFYDISLEQTKLLVTGIVTDQKGNPLPRGYSNRNKYR